MKQLILNTVALFIGLAAMAQPGSFDPTFANNAGIKYINFLEPESEATTHVLVDPQDRIWISGYTLIDGDFKLILSRLTPDGNYVLNFNDDGYAVINIGVSDFEEVKGMVWQNDHLLIAGQLTTNGIQTAFVLRYTNEGTLDSDFGEFGAAVLSENTALSDIKLDADNNIYLTGQNEGNITVAKLLPDGNPDNTFDDDGFRELTFASVGESASLAIKENGDIYILGQTTVAGTTKGLIHSLNPDGSNNTDWSITGRFVYSWPNELDFFVTDGLMSQTQDCFYLAGNTAGDQINAAAIAIDFEGNFKTTFGNNGRLEFDLTLGNDEVVNDIVESGHGLYFAMNIEEANGGIDAVMAHIDHQGDMVQAFGNQGWANYNLALAADDMALSMAKQSNGDIILLGILAGGEPGSFSGYAARVITEDETNGLTDLEFNLAKIYPNPALSQIQIELEDIANQGETLMIYNISGQLVYSDLLINANQTIEISNLAPGQYQMIIGEHTIGRFIKLK